LLADERVAPRAAEIDRTGEFPADLRRLLADHDVLALPFPAGAPGIYRTDHEGTLRERKRFAAAARALFARGYEVDGVAVRGSGPVYLLSRTQPPLLKSSRTP
ncbi:MAG TPA: acyl-CoA dehydrogenase family protein, partial [Thermoanaerobaculia bacterium]|nr:acyl-CoA dehydrogenase family protein [Thermoanaerobaculia bacterium]